jgi:hypothetical protein
MSHDNEHPNVESGLFARDPKLVALRPDLAPPPPVSGDVRVAISDDELMQALRSAGLARGEMIVTKWKDGIDIDLPSYKARNFADAIRAPSPSGEKK